MNRATLPLAVASWGWREGLTYGAMGWPLAFLALPLYVVLPHHYATTWGLPLGALGGVLLATRLVDAVSDPWIGRWVDRWFATSARQVHLRTGWAVVLLGVGFAALFTPPVVGLGLDARGLLWWLVAALVVTYLAYSVVAVAHQAWGARLGGDPVHRGRVVAWREACGLGGVVFSAALPAWGGVAALVWGLVVALVVGWALWWRAPAPGAEQAPAIPAAHAAQPEGPLWAPQHLAAPWAYPAFRRLFVVFVINGVASALPATLLLFFMQDRLVAPRSAEPVVLGLYFFAGALSLPVWLRLVARWGLAHTWLVGMSLAVVVFAGTVTLGAGDWPVFAIVCALSGLALGADLALPSALLSGVVAEVGERGRTEGAFVGWWALATKLNLALAAGVALPVLAWWGYTPGSQDPTALQALTWAYALLPCLLKALAAGALYVLLIRKGVS